MSGAICGGVMSNSMMKKGIRKCGAYFGMMAFTMPDTQYNRWVKYKKAGKEKEAKKVFERYAVSSI